jgi:hypothetical protein
MNDSDMMCALAQLPEAEMLCTSKIDDPIGSDVFYSGRTVVGLLDENRKAVRHFEHRENKKILIEIPMEGNFSQEERDAFCAGVRRLAQYLLHGR